jgi:hypothetical protein
MKKVFNLSLPFVMALYIFATGCTKEDNAPATNSNNAAAMVSGGSWVISSHIQRTENKTSNYSGMIFNFDADGKVTVTGSSSASGTWSYAPPTTGYYSSAASIATFTLNLGTGSPFNKLSRAWNVIEQSNTILKLDNREASEDEHITFTKK